MLVKEPRNRDGGDLVCGHVGVLTLQPVSEVFDGPDDLVNERDSMAASQEEANERVKERAEGAGTQTTDVVKPPKE